MTKVKVHLGAFVRLISAEDLLRGEEGQVKEDMGEGRWMVLLEAGARVYRHETELLVTFGGPAYYEPDEADLNPCPYCGRWPREGHADDCSSTIG